MYTYLEGPTLGLWRRLPATPAIGNDTPADGTSDEAPHRRRSCVWNCRRSCVEWSTIFRRLCAITGRVQEESEDSPFSAVLQSLTSTLSSVLVIVVPCPWSFGLRHDNLDVFDNNNNNGQTMLYRCLFGNCVCICLWRWHEDSVAVC